MSEPLKDKADGVLPRARVLSYLRVDTPPRVRRVAGVAVGVIGALFLSLAVAGGAWLVSEILPEIREFMYGRWVFYRPGAFSYPPHSPPTWSEFLLYELRRWAIPLLALAYFLSSGMVFCACTSRVQKGRRWPCMLCMTGLIPLLLMLIAAGAVAGAMGLFFGTGFFLRAKPAYLLLLVIMAVDILLLLLVWDLMSFLKWIARNPLVEKPAVAFLSVRK